MKADSPMASQVYQVGSNFYVVKLKERETPDISVFSTQVESLRETALSAKRTRVFRDWITSLRQRAHVELNPVLFANGANRDA
jgi:hypothetical protein